MQITLMKVSETLGEIALKLRELNSAESANKGELLVLLMDLKNKGLISAKTYKVLFNAAAKGQGID